MIRECQGIVSSIIAQKTKKRRQAALRPVVLRTAAMKISAGLFAAGALNSASMASAGSSLSYAGGTYSQNFDGLPTTITDVNASNTPTINGITYALPTTANTPFEFAANISSGGLSVSTMPGWYGYGATGTGNKNQFGAQAGSQTTGGVIDFGASNGSNRSLGLLATSSTSITSFGMELINNQSVSLNQISLSYLGQLWHQGTAAKTLNVAYSITSASAAMPLTGTALPSSYTVSNSTTGAVTATQLTSPIFNSSFGGTNTPIANWAPGQALWITWTISSSAGSGQGFSIDNLNFNASAASGSIINWNTGTGTWDASSPNWTGGSPVANLYKDGDFVSFGNIGTNSNITVGSISSGGVTPGTVTITNTASTYRFLGGSINGTGSLTMNGSGGTAILSAANNYSGGTVVMAGTLVANADSTLGLSGTGIILSGGTLQTGTALNSTRPIIVTGTAGTSVFNTGGFNSDFNNTLGVNDTFTVSGMANTGGLQIDGAVSFGTAGALNINNGATVTFNQPSGTINQNLNSTYNGKLVVTGAVRLNFNGNSSGGTSTSPPSVIAGIIAGTGEIDITNPGTVGPVVIAATKKNPEIDYNGNLTAVRITNASATLGGEINVPIQLNTANQYSFGNTFSRFDVTAGNASSGNFTVFIGGTNGSTPGTDPSVLDGYGIVINRPISGNADLNIANDATGGGGGYLILNAANTYAGATLVNTGDLVQIGTNNALPAGTDLVFGTIPNAAGGGTILDLNGYNQSVASLSSGAFGTHKNQITDNASTNSVLTVGTLNGAATPLLPYAGEIEDGLGATVSLTKTGPSCLSLSGANSYSGPTIINGGTLILTTTGTLASASYNIASGATLVLQGNFNSLSPTTGGNASPTITTAGTAILGPFANTGNNSAGITQVSTGALTLAGTGRFQLADPGLGNNASRTVLTAQSLTLSGTMGNWAGQLDLTGSDLILQSGTIATVTNQIRQGYNANGVGTWQGSSGISSSTAASDSTHLTALGVIVNDNGSGAAIYSLFDGATSNDGDLLVKYTYYGDATLDGHVDGSDYSRIDNGYLNQLTGWNNGDFNYDGVVNGSDYTLIDNAFNSQGAAFTAEIASPTSQLSHYTSTTVPEPSAISAIGVVVGTLLSRRKRRGFDAK